jgi:two-component system OmpR family sensor kinase
MSLRAKVTGVTVGVLAVGLIAAGVGTAVLLRNAQLAEREQSVSQTVTLDQTSNLLTVEVRDGVARFSAPATPPLTSFYIAVYGPDGDLLVTGGSSAGPAPEFPEEFRLEDAVMRGTTPFELHSADGKTSFYAAVDTLQISQARELNVQLLALPLTPVNQTVANFIGIYSILAILTILAGAIATRTAVTLAFRSLGQVEETAMSIAAGNFSQRMGDIAPGTEVGRLKTAINAMLDRIDHALGQRDASVRQMRRFIGDASHELRTPLVTVRGYAELYRMGAIRGDEQIAQSMDRIEKEAVRMGALVEDLLALARLDERRDLVIAAVDLRPIARDAVLDTRVTSPDRTVTMIDETAVIATVAETPRSAARRPAPNTETIARARRSGAGLAEATRSILRRRARHAAPAAESEGEASGPDTAPITRRVFDPVVLGDENRIRQVVANLLTNARRYTPEGTPLEVAVGVDEPTRMGWIAVVDHGEGIAPMIRDKIFQRFWRADTSRTRETGGSGLGLSIVASIVEALHGGIEVTETAGGGATFRVSFPLAQSLDAEDHLLIATQPLPRLTTREPESRGGSLPDD